MSKIGELLTDDTEQGQITIAGVSGLKYFMPFEEGHECTGQESHVLNQTLKENLRNNFAAHVKKAVDEAEKAGKKLDLDGLQREFDAYQEAYEFGIGGGGRETDPVRSLALQMAKTAVGQALKAKGYKLKDLKDKINELAEKALDQQPGFLARAKEIVEARRTAVDDLKIEDLG